MKNLLLLCIFLCSSFLTFAAPLHLEEGKDYYDAGVFLRILEDPEGKLTLQDVQQPEVIDRFEVNNKPVPNFGFTSSVYWAYFDIQNDHKGIQEWLLEFGYPLVDHLSFYAPDKTGQYAQHETGDQLSFESREITHHNFVFHVSAASGDTVRVFLRVKTSSSMQLPIKIWSVEGFTESVNGQVYGFGIYYGLMLSMIFYNLFIFLSTKDRDYLWYVLFICCFAALTMSLNGLAYEYLWPNSPFLANKATPLAVGTALFFALLFTQGFLNLKANNRVINKIAFFLECALGITIVIALFGDYRLAIKLNTVMAVPTVALFATAGIRSFIKGYRPATYFLLAWSALIIGSLLMALKAFGVLPSMFITDYGMQIGAAIEVILLSLGLADKINVMRKEKYIAEKEAARQAQAALESLQEADKLKDEMLTLIKTHNHGLEIKVAERTASIRGLLDNTGQGFFTFGADYKVNPEYSKACETFFGGSIDQKNALELLFSVDGSVKSVEELMGMLFGGMANMDMLGPMLPSELKVDDRFLHMELKYIEGEPGNEPKMMVILSDITKEKMLAEQLASDEERQQLIIKVATDKNGFIHFLHELEGLFDAVRTELAGVPESMDIAALFRIFHTIKGGAASYGLSHVAERAHHIENDLEPLRAGDEVPAVKHQEQIKAGNLDLEELLQKALQELSEIITPEDRSQSEDVYRISSSKIIKVQDFMLEKIGTEHRELIQTEIDRLYHQPMAPLLRKWAAVAEDIGVTLGKEVQVELIGMQEESSFKRLEGFFANLVHLIRNSVDHGLEETMVRQELGKPNSGKVTIEARREGEQYYFRVADDGAGIDQKIIKKVALGKGLITEEEAGRLSESEAVALIFAPGFSTKEEVSSFSGRGVGMDAIKTEVDKLGGKIEISTEVGKGSTFEFLIPA